MKLGSYIVPVETFTHNQFQRYTLYGFRLRASQNFGLPLGIESTVTLSMINFMIKRRPQRIFIKKMIQIKTTVFERASESTLVMTFDQNFMGYT